VVLCCCDSDYARRRSEALDEFTTDAPPFVEFAGAHVMTRAMGGLSPKIEPLNQAYDPTAAAELAAALEVCSIDSLVVPPRVRYLAERGALGHFRQSLRQLRSMVEGEGLEIDDAGPLVERWGAESLGTVEESCDGRPAKFARFMRRRAHAASASTSAGTGGTELFVLD
jgi:hypothetical protein